MEVRRASSTETVDEKGNQKKKIRKSSGLYRGKQRERRSFGEICRCAASLRLASVVTCAAAALFSH